MSRGDAHEVDHASVWFLEIFFLGIHLGVHLRPKSLARYMWLQYVIFDFHIIGMRIMRSAKVEDRLDHCYNQFKLTITRMPFIFENREMNRSNSLPASTSQR